MRKEIGGLSIDLFPPENPKFRSRLILIHGPWTGAWCWYAWATRFSNLGWECWIPHFHDIGRESTDWYRATFADRLKALRQVVRAAPSPPVLLGHSLGALLALKAAEEEETSAVTALAVPATGRGAGAHLSSLFRKYRVLFFLNRPVQLREKDLVLFWLASLPEHRRKAVLAETVAESSRFAAELFRPTVAPEAGRIGCPVLVVGGTADRVAPVNGMRQMARLLKAEIREYRDRGHWILGEEGWDEVVDDIHKWLVQQLGADLLLSELPEEE